MKTTQEIPKKIHFHATSSLIYKAQPHELHVTVLELLADLTAIVQDMERKMPNRKAIDELLDDPPN